MSCISRVYDADTGQSKPCGCKATVFHVMLYGEILKTCDKHQSQLVKSRYSTLEEAQLESLKRKL